MRISFLGPHATFTHQAVLLLPESSDAKLTPAATASAALSSVRRAEADFACVPIENSVEGAVSTVLDDLLADPPLVIVKEMQIPVKFALMARRGTPIQAIQTVGSHPLGIAQTRRWLAANLGQASTVMTNSTAEAAVRVARGEIDAAVSAPIAASVNELTVLAPDVADNPAAATRFALVRRPCAPPAPTGADRTLVAVTVINKPGSLAMALTELSMRGINITRLESRPNNTSPDSQWFYLDCAGHVAEPTMGEALAALKRRCTEVRFLGSYPCAGSSLGTLAPSSENGNRGAGFRDASSVTVPQDGGSFSSSLDWLRQVRAGTFS